MKEVSQKIDNESKERTDIVNYNKEMYQKLHDWIENIVHQEVKNYSFKFDQYEKTIKEIKSQLSNSEMSVE